MNPDKPQESLQKVSTRFLRDAFSQSPIDSIPFVNTLFRESISLQASDLLIEPMKEAIRFRAKIDGVLYEVGEITHDDYPEVSSRIKILAKLDPTEKRKIQEVEAIAMMLVNEQTHPTPETYTKIAEIMKKYPKAHKMMKKRFEEMKDNIDQFKEII